MARRFAGEFDSNEQFDTDIKHKGRKYPFGDELREAIRQRSVVIGGVLVAPGLDKLAEAMQVDTDAIVEAGQRIGAESDLDILSHATGHEVVKVSGYAIELDEDMGPIVETEPNVDLSTHSRTRANLIERIVAHNDPQDVVRFLGDLASTLARTMPE